MRFKITILGAPRTKKTGSYLKMVGRKRKLVPSDAWYRWCNTAQICHDRPHPLEGAMPRRPRIAVPVNCRAIFYRDARRGDATGFYQGLADLLEKREIVENDKWIRAWDGSRLRIDRQDPRVEVELTEMEEEEGKPHGSARC